MTLTQTQPADVATVDDDADAEIADRRVRLAQQAAAVRRRSRRIKTLRTLFPAAIVILVVGNFGWITIQSIVSSLDVYKGNTGEDRMTNPRFFGQGNNGDHYTISGLEAIRIGHDATTITLSSPSMDFKGDAERATHISADSGLYDQNAQTFLLKGNVVMVSGGSDMTFTTSEAVVDLAKSTFHGDKHIEGTGSVGHIVGESFVIADSGRDVTFHGRGEAKVTVTMAQGPAADADQQDTDEQGAATQ